MNCVVFFKLSWAWSLMFFEEGIERWIGGYAGHASLEEMVEGFGDGLEEAADESFVLDLVVVLGLAPVARGVGKGFVGDRGGG